MIKMYLQITLKKIIAFFVQYNQHPVTTRTPQIYMYIYLCLK